MPVEVLAAPETVAAYGQLGGDTARADESLTIPQSVVPGFGGLHLEMSSTAMVGLSEGARYLVEYPYGCAEQKGSRALAMVLAADLGDAFSLPGMDTAKMRPAVQKSLKELERFQCPNGGFTYWPGQCSWTSAYLTSYLLHVFKVAADLKYDVDRGMQQRAYSYLDRAAGAAATDQRELVAGLHGVAGIRGEGDGRRRAQPGLAPHPPLRLSRSDAGVRAGVPARRALGERGEVRTEGRRPAAADGQRDSSRGRLGARRGAERSVPALVLELQRAVDGDRAEFPRQGVGETRSRSGRSCAG